MRSVPWVAGCCGPMLRVMPSVSKLDVDAGVGGLAGDVGQLLAIGDGGHSRPPPRRSSSLVVAAGHGLDVDDARPRLHAPGEQREVLAQRVALELARQVEVDAGAGGRRR